MNTGRRIEVLLVEDNPGDVRLVKEALKDCEVPLNLTVAMDGEEACKILFESDGDKRGVRPDIILLDLNLPKRSGHEVLQCVKENSDLRTVPVLVVSSAASKEDVNRAYRMAANCYIRKPLDLDATLQTLRDVCAFWFQRVSLPTA